MMMMRNNVSVVEKSMSCDKCLLLVREAVSSLNTKHKNLNMIVEKEVWKPLFWVYVLRGNSYYYGIFCSGIVEYRV